MNVIPIRHHDNSLLIECGEWIVHPTQGLQKGSLYSTNNSTQKTVWFDRTFTPLSGVYGDKCEKSILLLVLEGLDF